MNLHNLETICLALAKDDGLGSITTLRNMIEDNKELITNEKNFYTKIAEAISSAIEIDKRFSDALTRESTDKIAYLIGLMTKVENLETIILNLAKRNRSATNVVIMMFCNHEQTAKVCRQTLTDNIDEFVENHNLIDMVCKFSNFSSDKLLEFGNAIENLDKSRKESANNIKISSKRESYLKLILLALEDMPEPRITNKFLEQVFALQSSNDSDERILNLLVQRDLFNKCSIDRIAFVEYLKRVHNDSALERIIDRKADILPVEDYKKLTNLQEIVEMAVESNRYNNNWEGLLRRLKSDIGKNNVLSICNPEEAIYISTGLEDKSHPENDQEKAENLKTVIANVDDKNLPKKNYYEDFLTKLIEQRRNVGSYVPVITTILSEHNIDMSYHPFSTCSLESLEYSLATSNDLEIIKGFLKQEPSNSVITGPGPSISLSFLYFKVGNISKGLAEFKRLELLGENEQSELIIRGAYQIEYEEGYGYKDNLTQIVEAIAELEVDNELKKQFLLEILFDSRLKTINVEILPLLASIYQPEELAAIYEELSTSPNNLFVASQREKMSERVTEIRVLTAEELEELQNNFTNKPKMNIKN